MIPNNVDPSSVRPLEALTPNDPTEAADIAALVDGAKDFISSFPWCLGVHDLYAGIAIGGVVGVFLVKIIPRDQDVDDWVWVVSGDLPPAYIVLDDAPTPEAALSRYTEEMQQWVDAVTAGKPVDDLIPIDQAPTPEHAKMLASRLDFLRRRILPGGERDESA